MIRMSVSGTHLTAANRSNRQLSAEHSARRQRSRAAAAALRVDVAPQMAAARADAYRPPTASHALGDGRWLVTVHDHACPVRPWPGGALLVFEFVARAFGAHGGGGRLTEVGGVSEWVRAHVVGWPVVVTVDRDPYPGEADPQPVVGVSIDVDPATGRVSCDVPAGAAPGAVAAAVADAMARCAAGARPEGAA